MKDIIKKVIAKLMKPTLGSFYILGGIVYISTFKAGLQHKELWKKIVDVAFKDIFPEDKSLLLKANYGADRGRVSWDGEIIDHKPIGEGQYLIEGTLGCAKYLKEIKNSFGLNNIKVIVDWEDNPAYITVRDEKEIVNKMLEKYPISHQNIHVAKIINLDNYKGA